MDQQAIKGSVQYLDDSFLKFILIIRPFYEYVAQADVGATERELTIFYAGKYWVEFKAKRLAPEGVEFNDEDIRSLLQEKAGKQIDPLFFYIIELSVFIARGKIFKVPVHLQSRKREELYWCRDGVDIRPTNDEDDFVVFSECLADLKASVEVTNAQNVLTVVGNLHGFSQVMLSLVIWYPEVVNWNSCIQFFSTIFVSSSRNFLPAIS